MISSSMVIKVKNRIALIRMALIPIRVISASPVAMGIIIATATSEATSSRIAEVIIPVAAGEFCKFSLFSDTIVRETAVAVIANPQIIAKRGSPQ